MSRLLLLLLVASCASPVASVPSAERSRPISGARPEPTVVLRRGTALWGEQWPEDFDWPTATLSYHDTLFLCGQRSGLFSPNAGPISDREAWNARRPVVLTDCTFLSADPNYPWAVGETGTYWASRAHLISSCQVEDIVVRDLFGSSYSGQHPLVTSNEGHGLYWTMAPGPESRYMLRRLDFRNMGGHGVQFVTATGAREGLDAPPRPGGSMLMEDCYFENTDRAPARGSSTISFFDLPIDVLLRDVVVVHGLDGATYPVWGWDGTPEDAYTARGCMVQRGWMASLTIEGGAYVQLGGRPDRSALSFRGCEVVTIRGAVIRGNVVVNWPSDGVEHWTKRIILEGCTGEGGLWVGKQFVGSVTANHDLDLTKPIQPSPERVKTIDDSAHDNPWNSL